MLIRNRHERVVPRAEPVAALLDGLASAADGLWPSGAWPRLRLDRPLQVGARGGHGPIRYWVELYEPGKRVRFRFERPVGFHGFHEFQLIRGGARPPALAHLLEVEASWRAAALWWLGLGALHDALIEDALDRAERAAGGAVACPARWNGRVRLLRALSGRSRLPRRTHRAAAAARRTQRAAGRRCPAESKPRPRGG